MSEFLRPAASPALASPCLKAFGVSPWSPPPHVRRMRGDIVYLTVTTLEGETVTITGATSGFWISAISQTTFNPLPRPVMPKGIKNSTYHNLFELLTDLSPLFKSNLAVLLAAQNPSHASPDVLNTLQITHPAPNAPWLVPAPVHTADPFRTQLAYLVTTSTTAENLPPARDWSEELAQARELPRATMQDRLFRERLVYRTQADFTTAATRGALSIARGDVPPLNPNEPPAAHTFLHNNMLFTRAEDVINAYDHIGGNEAARVAAAKDLAGVNLLERADVEGVHTMATVLVDFCGERWVVQSLIPGLFKAREDDDELDAEAQKAADEAKATDLPLPSEETPNKADYPPANHFRIVYGSANPELPDEKVRASAYFGKLAHKVADELKLAEHSVTDKDGRQTKLWTSADMHGLAALDGRSYFIDCFRTHCTDIEFLENNVAGPVFGSDDKAVYPHRLVLLRPELLENYRESKLTKWIEDKVIAHRAKVAEEQANKAEPAAGSVESELKEAAQEGEAPKADEAPKAPAPVINAADFELSFNPDAFVERKPENEGKAALVIYDAVDPATQAVRDASVYLREVVLLNFVVEVGTSGLVVSDGKFLTKLLHRKGINMRYLGMLANLVDSKGPELEFGRTTKHDAQLALAGLSRGLKQEMVGRAAKHILNRQLRAASSYDHPYVIAHFLNALLGKAYEPSPVAETAPLPAGVEADRAWTSVTPESLEAEITAEIKARFLYSLEAGFVATVPSVPLLRDIASKTGVQLVLREYNFSAQPAALTNGNGALADEDRADSLVAAAKGKKAKKAAAKASPKPDGPRQKLSFRPEDVLNLSPIAKTTQHKSALADEAFFAGQRQLNEDNIEVGMDLVQDGVQLTDQIFGAVHPEAATKYHQLGITYHGLATSLARKVAVHEAIEEALKEATAENKAQLQTQADQLLLPNIEAARAELEHYQSLAVQMVRQSIIITERTLGLDGHDTIQAYTDLGLLEQQVGNTLVGLRLTRHALNLWAATYGPSHPQSLNLLTNAATMVQTMFGFKAGIEMLLQCQALAQRIHGERSIQVATIVNQIAQFHAVLQDIDSALPFIRQASEIYTEVLGPEHKDAVEATTFVQAIEQHLAGQKKQQEERVRQAKLLAKGQKGPKQVAGANGAKAEAVPAAVEEVKAHGQKADLSVEELVKYISGAPNGKAGAKGKKARKN